MEDPPKMEGNLWQANLQGADLRGAKGLTHEQLEQAIGDENTELPEGLHPPASWTQGVAGQTDKQD
jgi:hypothetical protein